MERDLSASPFANLFVTAGKMGGLIREYNWSDSKLGEMQTWPQSLQSAVSICMNSNFPIAIYWGNDLVLIYNDAWSPIPGNKHPWALGKPAIEVWPEIWNDIEPQFQKAFKGIPGGSKDALLPMQRHGYTEECYFDFTFTPIYGESGRIEGIFNAVIETTYRVINERRAVLLQKLSDTINSISNAEDVFGKASHIFNSAQADIPFYSIVEFNSDESPVIRACSAAMQGLDLWQINEIKSGVFKHIENLNDSGLQFPATFWPEVPREAVIAPLKANDGAVFGCIIAVVSARRKYDKDYRTFFESIATIVAGELNTIKSLTEERKRTQALAEIDKAKTTFFSNISHEFRTPLTLMIGPLESILEKDILPPEEKDNLSTAYRNTLRLQKLVNTLLDFSKIEAGKMEANFEPVEISKLTQDLASSFRSAIESAGLEYEVRVDEINAVAHVDRDMWEKIVLNLISNAFKYTKKGKIKVTISHEGESIALKVSDTGVGISADDQTKIFQRFYRVNNPDARSLEGTGIGLAMVKELVNLHQGEIVAESKLGIGSTFAVTIPTSRTNTTAKALSNDEPKRSVRSHFIKEALQWTDNGNSSGHNTQGSNNSSKPRVLLADDNSDMRAYVERLLQEDYDVRTVTNGEEAFSYALDWTPDLILSDIMMPTLDGFGLLQKLKGSLVTRNIPIIFLSARAGEEAKVEGIMAGVDDYLIKPFSAKELVARVTNQILISKTRRKTEKEFYNLFLQAPAHIHVMKGPDHTMEFFHPLGKKFIGGRDITGMKIRDALPEVAGQGYFEMLDQVYREGKSIHLPESKATFPNEHGKPEDFYFSITYLPLKNVDGGIEGVLQFSTDVTEHVKANQKIKESEERFRLLVTSVPQIIWIADNNSNIEFLSQQWETYTGVNVEEGRNKFSSYIHQDDIEMVRQRWVESIKSKTAWKAEYRLNDTRTNEYRWFFGHTQPLLNQNGEIIKWIGSAADIQLQKMANEQLEGLVAERTSELIDLNKMLKSKNDELSKAQTFLQTVLDASVELVTAFDKKLNFTFVNNRLTAFSSRTPQQLVGKNLMDIHPGFEKTEGYDHLQRALKGETIHLEERRPHLDNSLVFETFMIPLRQYGEVTGVVTMQRDITSIVKLTENLKVSNEQLKRSNEDLQQFAHVTSHDLKEPVRKIKMYGNILKTDYSQILPERGRDYLDKIERATSRIWAMIDGILQYSSIDGVDEVIQPVRINELMKAISEDLELAINEANAKITYSSLPTINGSPTLLYQLFYNLIFNSLKFRSNEREPSISITAHLEIEEGQEYLRIDLKDNGIGFHSDFAEKIFESFSRLYPKDKYEGTGLGLALCKKIILRHGGFIKANGEDNVGATFSMFFPKKSVITN